MCVESANNVLLIASPWVLAYDMGVDMCCLQLLITFTPTLSTIKPRGMNEDDAYLKAVPNCTLTFVYSERGNSTKERWYSCGNCTTTCISQDQHVGYVMEDADLKRL